jgi:hypothetical protein
MFHCLNVFVDTLFCIVWKLAEFLFYVMRRGCPKFHALRIQQMMQFCIPYFIRSVGDAGKIFTRGGGPDLETIDWPFMLVSAGVQPASVAEQLHCLSRYTERERERA